MSNGSSQMSYLIYVGVACCVAFVGFRAVGKRDVIGYSDTATISQSDGVILFEARIDGLRDDCVLRGGPSDTIIVDSGGLEFFINQRGGHRSNIPKRTLDVTLEIERPRFMRDGPARLYFNHTFQCGSWSVQQTSPAYSFNAGSEGD